MELNVKFKHHVMIKFFVILCRVTMTDIWPTHKECDDFTHCVILHGRVAVKFTRIRLSRVIPCKNRSKSSPIERQRFAEENVFE